MALADQIGYGLDRRGSIVDTHIRHGNLIVEFATCHPWKRHAPFVQGMLNRIGVQTNGAVGATRLQQVEIAAFAAGVRSSEERRVGKECGSTCRSRWSRDA